MKKKTIIILCVLILIGLFLYITIFNYKNQKQEEFQQLWLQYNIATKNYTTDSIFDDEDPSSQKKFMDHQTFIANFLNLPDLIPLLNQQIILYDNVINAYKGNFNADQASLDLMENNTSIADFLSDNLNLDKNITRRMFYDRLIILTDICVAIFMEVAQKDLPLVNDKLLDLHKKLLIQSDIMGKFLSSSL